MTTFIYPVIIAVIVTLVWLWLRLAKSAVYIKKKKEIDFALMIILISILLLGVAKPLATGCKVVNNRPSLGIFYSEVVCTNGGLFAPEANKFIAKWAALPLMLGFVIWYKRFRK